jgi:hypothetical protein
VREKLDEDWERERAARAVREKLAGPARAGGGAGEAAAGGAGDEAEEFDAGMRRKIMDKRRELGDPQQAPPPSAAAAVPRADGRETREEKEARHAARTRAKEEREAAKRAHEAEKLKRLGLTKMAAEVDAGLLTAGEVKRRAIKAGKARTAEREKETLEKLARFQQGLAAAPAAAPAAPDGDVGAREGAAGVARYVSQGLYYMEEEDGDDEEDPHAWKRHALGFVATKDARSFAPGVDDYVVSDPLAEKGAAGFDAQRHKDSKRASAWAGKSHT